MRREFSARHPYTRRLAEVALTQSRLWQGIPTTGLALASVASGLGLTRVANQTCSALFTAAYWRGVAAQLGSVEAALRLMKPPPPAVSPAELAP